MISESKRAIAGVAALLILMFHCWVSVFAFGSVPGLIERFIVTTAYVGVDIFFFISAYSLARRPVERGLKPYARFVGSRALRILPYFLIALLAGQFIWFLPAIMVMYILFPPVYRFCDRRPILGSSLTVVVWAALVYILLGLIDTPWDFGIALFRAPVIMLGAYFGRTSLKSVTSYVTTSTYDDDYYEFDYEREYRELANVKNYSGVKLLMSLGLLAIGILLVNRFGYLSKLNTPFKGTFYMMAIPMALGIILLIDYMYSIKRLRALEFIGSFTLELYFMQMVLGGWMIERSYAMLGSRFLTNVVVFVVLIASSWLLHIGTEAAAKLISQTKHEA